MSLNAIPLLAAWLVASTLCATAQAQSSPWSLQVAPGTEALGIRSSLVLPMGLGSSATMGDLHPRSVSAELTHSATPDWAAHMAVMASYSGANASSAASRLSTGQPLQAVVGLFVSHRFAPVGSLVPFASAGVVYESGRLGWQAPGSQTTDRNPWSLAMQAGFKSPRSQAWRLLLDLKRQQRLADAEGQRPSLQWSPTRVSLKLSPLRVSVGTSLQF